MTTEMSYKFNHNQRLGISIPELNKEWDEYSAKEQEQILVEWEEYRSDIPGRIKEIERVIEKRQLELNIEENFPRSCELNSEISELASTINDLNIWFRIQQDTHVKVHQ
jgi:hypothetical protein